MRSSKSRSRSKSNRNRPSGNIVNRVFDSSGPEGKVRGTPQQIIDKYNQLARDAQLSNDRVAFENFQQHAEHYTRLLGEAQREMEARREQQERERERQHQQRDQRREETGGDQQGGGERSEEPAPDVIDTSAGSDSGLVETPENTPPKPRRGRRPRNDAPRDPAPAQADPAPDAAAEPDAAKGDAPEAAE